MINNHLQLMQEISHNGDDTVIEERVRMVFRSRRLFKELFYVRFISLYLIQWINNEQRFQKTKSNLFIAN